ncbi:hypothetical protein BKA62DRAFT_773116 [Auriculariales sp. MPI-PUGE-AT-0066]|nr:hypothetical protein BKA62DRAFT_773116 [Auriculariales sp. MPI-PUGE-AT-0066]
MSSTEMLDLMKEPLNAYEQAILDAQSKRPPAMERRLVSSTSPFSLVAACSAVKLPAGMPPHDPPPHVPAESWNDFLTVNNDAYAILRSMDKDDYAYWEHRCKILHAHHRAQFPDYTFAPKHLPREEKVRRHEEKNRLRLQKGLKPVDGPKPRGRPSTKNRGVGGGAMGIDVPDHIFTHGLELKSVALPRCSRSRITTPP